MVDFGAGRSAVRIAVGGVHHCAVLDNGDTKCWGRNGGGQLGLGDTVDRGDGANEMGDLLPTVDLGTGRSAVKLSAGLEHSCALLDDSKMKCWGDNLFGQLGLGDTLDRGDGVNEMGDLLPTVDL